MRDGYRIRTLSSALLLPLGMVLSVGCEVSHSSSSGCERDSDCEEDRICAEGACVESDARSPSPEGSGNQPVATPGSGEAESCGPSSAGCNGCIAKAPHEGDLGCAGLQAEAESNPAWPALQACIVQAAGDHQALNACEKSQELVGYYVCMAESCGACCLCEGTCCQPSCAGKTCGDDGCGGSCGACPAGKACSSGACTEPRDYCTECLDSCQGLPGCCVGSGCICDSAC
jgi:hypothetical protein